MKHMQIYTRRIKSGSDSELKKLLISYSLVVSKNVLFPFYFGISKVSMMNLYSFGAINPFLGLAEVLGSDISLKASIISPTFSISVILVRKSEVPVAGFSTVGGGGEPRLIHWCLCLYI